MSNKKRQSRVEWTDKGFVYHCDPNCEMCEVERELLEDLEADELEPEQPCRHPQEKMRWVGPWELGNGYFECTSCGQEVPDEPGLG